MAARGKIQGWGEDGGRTVTTAGLVSSTKVQQSFPSCTVTVFDGGTVNLSTIYADMAGTPKANPFTADVHGRWFFYTDGAGRYDVQFSGGGITTPFTLGDMAPEIASVYQDARAFPGANAGAQIIAALAATPNGIVDARLLTGTITSQIVIGQNQTLLLGSGIYTCNLVSAPFLISASGAKLIGQGFGDGTAPSGGQTVLRASGFAATTDMIVVQGSAGAIITNVEVANLKLDFNNPATAGRYGIFIENAQDCHFHDLDIWNAGADSVRIQPSGVLAAAYRNLFENVHTLGFGVSGLRLQATGEITLNTFINCEFDANGIAASSHAVYLQVPAGSAITQSINTTTFVNLHAIVASIGNNAFEVEQVSGVGQIKDLSIVGGSLERIGGNGGTGFNVTTSSAADVLNISLNPVSFANLSAGHNLSSSTVTGYFVAESGSAYKISALEFQIRSGNTNELRFANPGSGTYGVSSDASGGIHFRRIDVPTDLFLMNFQGLFPITDNAVSIGLSNLRPSTVFGVNGQFDAQVKVGPTGVAITSIAAFTANLTPSLFGTTTSEQSFTVNGILATDAIFVSPPTTPVAGTGIAAARAGFNTAIITFFNQTGGNVTPSAGNYLIVAIRH